MFYLFRAESPNTRQLHESSVQSDFTDDASMDSRDNEMDDRLTHLSAFALNGRDGKVRWHHVAGDFEKSPAKVLHFFIY